MPPSCPRVKSASVAPAWLVPGALTAGGGSPPQIVDYSPERGAIDVSTAAPILITFDHDVDKSSVESRLSLLPAIGGNVVWLGPRSLEYKHATLQPSKIYEGVLLAGYKDLTGNAYALRHHWTFTTERPPNVASTTPANNEDDGGP